MVNRELLDFIKTQLQAGTTKEKISNDLLANGWGAGDVEEGFRATNPIPDLSGIPTPSNVPINSNVNLSSAQTRHLSKYMKSSSVSCFLILSSLLIFIPFPIVLAIDRENLFFGLIGAGIMFISSLFFEFIVFYCFWQYKKNYSFPIIVPVLAIIHLIIIPLGTLFAPFYLKIGTYGYFISFIFLPFNIIHKSMIDSSSLVLISPFLLLFLINIVFSIWVLFSTLV